MSLIKKNLIKNSLTVNIFDTCLIDGVSSLEIKVKMAGRKNGPYYLDKFAKHLSSNHKMSLKDYVKTHLKIPWPICPISKEEVGYIIRGFGILFSTFKPGCVTKEFSPAMRLHSERMSKNRKGEKNPMFGSKAWNNGITKEDHLSMMAVSKKMTGRVVGEATRSKHRKNRAESLIKARHTVAHSKETIDALRLETASRYSRGVYKRKTKIQILLSKYLSQVGVPHEEEYLIGFYSIDLAIPSAKVAIEADGDYFHSNPAEYPDGPKDAIQRKNAIRDKQKNSYMLNHGWTLIRYWETDINKLDFKEKLICDLKKLRLLS